MVETCPVTVEFYQKPRKARVRVAAPIGEADFQYFDLFEEPSGDLVLRSILEKHTFLIEKRTVTGYRAEVVRRPRVNA